MNRLYIFYAGDNNLKKLEKLNWKDCFMNSKKTSGIFDVTTLINSLVNWSEPRSLTALSATQLVKNIPETEFFKTQVEIVKAVSRINEDQSIKLKELINTLLYVDERAHPIHMNLSDEFLRGTSNSKSFLPVILAYQHEFSRAYLNALQRYIESRATNMETEMEQVALRGLLHFSRQVFWDAQRYIATEGQIWKHCYYFYNYFEKINKTKKLIKIYQNEKILVSAEKLLLSAAMLDLAQPCNLESSEICAVDHLISIVTDNQSISTDPLPSTRTYVINIDSSSTPQPMRRNMIGNRFRYFSTQPVFDIFEKLKQQLNVEIPKVLEGANVEFAIPQWNELLLKLEPQWLFDGKGSRRAIERVFTSFNVKVAVGFKQIAFQSKMVASAYQEDILNQWKVVNAGENSYSLVYEGLNSQQLRLGNLILIQPGDDSPSICIIKQLVRQTDNKAKLGVMVIGKAPVGVTLSGISSSKDITEPVSALYITQSNATDGKRWFLLPSDYAKIGKEYTLTVQGKSYHIRLKAPFVDMDGCVNSDFDTLARVE